MIDAPYVLTVEGSEGGAFDGEYPCSSEQDAMEFGSHLADTELHATGESTATITIRKGSDR